MFTTTRLIPPASFMVATLRHRHAQDLPRRDRSSPLDVGCPCGVLKRNHQRHRRTVSCPVPITSRASLTELDSAAWRLPTSLPCSFTWLTSVCLSVLCFTGLSSLAFFVVSDSHGMTILLVRCEDCQAESSSGRHGIASTCGRRTIMQACTCSTVSC